MHPASRRWLIVAALFVVSYGISSASEATAQRRPAGRTEATGVADPRFNPSPVVDK